MTTQQGPSGPCRCPRWVRHGVHAGDRLGIPAPDTTTTDQGRGAGRRGRPTLQSAHAAYASHLPLWSTKAAGRQQERTADAGKVRRFGFACRLTGRCRTSAVTHPASIVFPLLTTSRKPSRYPYGFTVDRMSCFLWSGEGVVNPGDSRGLIGALVRSSCRLPLLDLLLALLRLPARHGCAGAGPDQR